MPAAVVANSPDAKPTRLPPLRTGSAQWSSVPPPDMDREGAGARDAEPNPTAENGGEAVAPASAPTLAPGRMMTECSVQLPGTVSSAPSAHIGEPTLEALSVESNLQPGPSHEESQGGVEQAKSAFPLEVQPGDKVTVTGAGWKGELCSVVAVHGAECQVDLGGKKFTVPKSICFDMHGCCIDPEGQLDTHPAFFDDQQQQ